MFVLLLLSSGLFVLQFGFVQASPGWLTGWSYRKSHVINNATGAGTNYQMSITVINGTGADSASIVYIDGTVSGKLRSDFGDIRFTDNDEVTLLD